MIFSGIHKAGAIAGWCLFLFAAQTIHAQTMGTGKLNFITNIDSFPEVKMDFPITTGPFEPTWESIDKNYGAPPAWFRDARFGIWVHWGPQAFGKSGDWYARKMYDDTTLAYRNHIKNFGHPSEFGYKDVLNQWKPDQWDPSKIMGLFNKAGARYVVIMGVHHDNFDLWNSKYQPWNSVNIGPKRDILGEWKKEAKKYQMRFGVSFHHEYSWWWYQTAFESDKTGPKAGVPYDGNLSKEDGKGKWWEGYNPRLLYTIDLHQYPDVKNIAWGKGIFGDHLDYAHWYATNWANRIMDVIDNYDPDFIYTDGNSTQPFSGYRSGSGYKCDAAARVVAHFYNRSIREKGFNDKISFIKFIPKNKGVATTREGSYYPDIKTDQVWMGENAVGDWFYSPGFVYDAGMVIKALLEHVSRDGNFAVCISIQPDGALDEGSQKLLKEIGDWMTVNGEGIYGSKAWKKFGEGEMIPNPKKPETQQLRVLPAGKLGKKQADFAFSSKDFRFTVGKDGALYAYCMTVPANEEKIKIVSLGKNANLLDKRIVQVSLLGYKGKINWKQEKDGLVITCPKKMTSKISAGFKISTEK